MAVENSSTINLFGYEIDFCKEASIVSECIALLQIIQFIIFYCYRKEDGIEARRPAFTYSFCIISTIYFIFIIPSTCSQYTIQYQFLPFIGWYLLRCCCIFMWFWTLICKYWFLYFDYNYVILLRLQAMHNITSQKKLNGVGNTETIETPNNEPPPIITDANEFMKNKWNQTQNITAYDTDTTPTDPENGRSTPSKSIFGTSKDNGGDIIKPKWFAKHKKDYGNPKKASLYIGIYFLLCFLVLLFVCIYEHLFDDPQLNVFEKYSVSADEDVEKYFSRAQVIEIAFITMCYVPFIVALIFTCRIWTISESWKIKQEILTISIVTAVLFIGDTAMTGIVYWEESTRFFMKLTLESLIMLWTTIISTIMIVHFIRKQNKKVERRRSAVRDKRALSRELIKEISQGNIVEVDGDGKQTEDEVPLGYVLANQLGYSAFLQHCVEEINVENLLFLAHVCYFKKRFLDRIKNRQIQQNRKIKAMLKADKERKNKHRKSKINDDRNKMPTIVDNEDENNEENVEIVENDDDEMPEDEIIELQSITTDSKLTIKVDVDDTEDNMTSNNEMASNEDLTSVASTKMNETGTSFATIKTDVAVYDDDCNNEEIDEKLLNQSIDWSPSNCLAILTFRMCHNFERNHNRLTLIDEQDDDLADYGYDENGKRRPLPLYVMATNLYKTFIKESGEYEINLPAKVKTKLHFFFHQNFKDLEEADLQYHEYRLFHIFDKAWAEIWHLLTLNSYRRFLDTEHYVSIKEQLEMALSDEKRSLLRLIVLDSNNDQHIATLIESHDPYKRRKINGKNTHRLNNISNMSTMNALSPTTDKERLNSMNIEEMNDLNPTSLVNIGVDPLPIAEQVHHFGKTMTRVKKAKV